MERTAGGACWKDIPRRPGIYVVYLPDGLTSSLPASIISRRIEARGRNISG